MATDMPALARTIVKTTPHPALKKALGAAATKAEAEGILARLAIFGRAVSAAVASTEDPAYLWIARHRSDVVRQWAAYAANDPVRRMTLGKRLGLTLPFAADPHMSVRECAWMAFRPHLAGLLSEALKLLEPVTLSPNENLRRFAIEVSRPRSVWGAHIPALKHDPGQALALLDNVLQDGSKYVRLSAGNWLNDASKSRPDWVRTVCNRWSQNANKHTEAIIRRGLRTLAREARRRDHELTVLPLAGLTGGGRPSGGPQRRAVC